MKISSFKNQRTAYKKNKSKMYKDCSGFRFLKIKTLRGNHQISGTCDTNDYESTISAPCSHSNRDRD